jgi:Fe-S cluster assembly protein SufB
MSTTTATKQDNLRQTLDSADDFAYGKQLKGLNEDVVRAISAELGEPDWMLKHRLKSLKLFNEMPLPTW